MGQLTDGGDKKATLPKICHTHPSIIKLGSYTLQKEDTKKYMNHVIHPFSSSDISIFSPEISKFCYFKNYSYRLHIDTEFLVLSYFEFSKISLIKMNAILMMSAKMATPDLFKIGVF